MPALPSGLLALNNPFKVNILLVAFYSACLNIKFSYYTTATMTMIFLLSLNGFTTALSFILSWVCKALFKQLVFPIHKKKNLEEKEKKVLFFEGWEN